MRKETVKTTNKPEEGVAGWWYGVRELKAIFRMHYQVIILIIQQPGLSIFWFQHMLGNIFLKGQFLKMQDKTFSPVSSITGVRVSKRCIMSGSFVCWGWVKQRGLCISENEIMLNLLDTNVRLSVATQLLYLPLMNSITHCMPSLPCTRNF